MLADIKQSDVTGTVNMVDPGAVADAVCGILARRYEGFDPAPMRRGFADIEDAFWGRYPGLLQCDTPYHDLRHSLSTALVMTRMVDGYEMAHGADKPALGREEGCLAVILALFHDIGFLRRDSETAINGACLVRDHEQRGVDFVSSYLAGGPFARYAAHADLIHATNFARPIADTLKGVPPALYLIGQMLGTADLVSQIAGRYYIERCQRFLYQEFVVAGLDRMQSPGGDTVVLYGTAEELLRKTPAFYEHLVKRRLDVDFDRVYRYLAVHFGGDDPYARAMQRNLDYLRGMIERNDFSSLRRKPIPLMPLPRE